MPLRHLVEINDAALISILPVSAVAMLNTASMLTAGISMQGIVQRQ